MIYDIKAQTILDAVKKDDLSLFRSVYSSDTASYCFGRFPLLSLCYLYNSNRILFSYEKKLLSVTRYTQAGEDRESYIIFRQKAKKCLRLYITNLVSPVEMLAVLGRQDYLSQISSMITINEDVFQRVRYVSKTLFGSEVLFQDKKIVFKKKVFTFEQKTGMLFSCVTSVIFVILSILACFAVQSNQSRDTIQLKTDNQFERAMEQENGSFELTSDIVVSSRIYENNFSGTLNGNGHTVTVLTEETGSLLPSLDGGTVKNVTFLAQKAFTLVEENNGTIEDVTVVTTLPSQAIEKNTSYFVNKNNGTIRNVSISLTSSITVNSVKQTEESAESTDIYLAIIGQENNGTVENCSVEYNVSLVNPNGGNVFFAPYFAHNYGTIQNCSVKNSSCTADTVDIAGLVCENGSEDNYENAVIDMCNISSDLSQVCAIEQWSPNVGGLALYNYGKITSCTYDGTMHAESTFEGEDYKYFINQGGISVYNAGSITFCNYRGTITGSSLSGYGTVGGIVAQNSLASNKTITDEYGAYTTIVFLQGAIENCYTEGTLRIDCSKQRAYVGGIAGENYGTFIAYEDTTYFFSQTSYRYNYGSISSCQSVLQIEGGSNLWAGGISSINHGTIDACISTCSFTTQDSAVIGGISAYNSCSVSSYYSQTTYKAIACSQARITVQSTDTSYVGGIVAVNYSTNSYVLGYVDECDAEVDITVGKESYVGGVAGNNSSLLQSCFGSGKITAGELSYIGGIVAHNSYYVQYCNASIDIVSGDSCCNGGIAGSNSQYVVYCIARGNITTRGTGSTGGIVGLNYYLVQHCCSFMDFSVGENVSVGYIIGTCDAQCVTSCLYYQDNNATERSYFYKNAYVLRENVTYAFGIIPDLIIAEGRSESEYYNIQATMFETENNLLTSELYKENNKMEEKRNESTDQTGQGNTTVSYRFTGHSDF